MQGEVDKMGDLASAHRTVTESVEAWLEVRQAKEIQPGTRVIDQWSAQLIIRGLGGHRLASLTVADCDTFLAAVAQGDYGGAMGRPQVRRLRQKLIRVVENDERLGLVARNVARLSVLPDAPQTAAERRPARAIPADQIRDLITEADGPVGVLIDLSGRNGLRPAEARGVRWCNIDLDARTLRVDRQMNRPTNWHRSRPDRVPTRPLATHLADQSEVVFHSPVGKLLIAVDQLTLIEPGHLRLASARSTH